MEIQQTKNGQFRVVGDTLYPNLTFASEETARLHAGWVQEQLERKQRKETPNKETQNND